MHVCVCVCVRVFFFCLVGIDRADRLVTGKYIKPLVAKSVIRFVVRTPQVVRVYECRVRAWVVSETSKALYHLSAQSTHVPLVEQHRGAAGVSWGGVAFSLVPVFSPFSTPPVET